MRLPGVHEAACDNDSPRCQIDLQDARLDEWQEDAAVELENVVRDTRLDALHAPELPSALLLDLEADQLERVVRARFELGQRGARHGQLGAALDVAVETDDAPPLSRTLRFDDARRLAADEELGPGRESLWILARALDEERAAEAVRPADAADRHEFVGVHHSLQLLRRVSLRREVLRRPNQARSASVNDLEQDAAALTASGRPHDRTQRARDPALAPDHLADVVRRNVQPQHERVRFVDLLDANGVRLVDELSRQVLDQL
jgi:hypothetical protein